jgi:etoposide-induced 2.4 mRNA
MELAWLPRRVSLASCDRNCGRVSTELLPAGSLEVNLYKSDAEIRANVLKSLLLNCLSLTSIYMFDLLLVPLVRDQQKWLHRNVGWFYQILWLLPVVGVSFYLNVRREFQWSFNVYDNGITASYNPPLICARLQSSWCTLIAKRTYTLQHGSRSAVQQQPVSYTGLLTALATSAYRVVMVFTSVVVSFALSMIPFVGPFASFVFLSWIDA